MTPAPSRNTRLPKTDRCGFASHDEQSPLGCTYARASVIIPKTSRGSGGIQGWGVGEVGADWLSALGCRLKLLGERHTERGALSLPGASEAGTALVLSFAPPL